MGEYLVREGFLGDPADLRPELRSEAPPELLDPDSIWTGAPLDIEAFSTDDSTTQEVQST